MESYINYNFSTGEVTWVRKEGILVMMKICNFPNTAKQWLSNTDSISVIIDGATYMPATNSSINPTDRVFYDFVILNIKKK